jgi:hypothetical protein
MSFSEAAQALCNLIKDHTVSVLWVQVVNEYGALRIQNVSVFFGLESDENAKTEISRDKAILDPAAARFFLAAETWMIDYSVGTLKPELTAVVLDSFDDVFRATEKARTPETIEVIKLLSHRMSVARNDKQPYRRVHGVHDVRKQFKLALGEASTAVKRSGFEFDPEPV